MQSKLESEAGPVRLGPYLLSRRLGSGGMGEVYEATHALMKSRRFAIKILKSTQPANDQLIRRFLREIEAQAALSPHPNLVRAEFADFEGDAPYLVMEYVEGVDLEQLLGRAGPLASAEACAIVAQAAAGLQAIHEAGLVHRDLKPSNLMLTRTGTVKILDLGLARLLDPEDEREELTASNCLMGTMDYMAPEQAENPRAADIRSDLYSLGCTLYKLLTASAPYAGIPGRAKKVHAHAHLPFPQLPMAVPRKLRLALDRMTAKLPEHRYAAPNQLLRDLEELAAAADLARLFERSSSRGTQALSEGSTSPSAQVATIPDLKIPGSTKPLSSLLNSPSHAVAAGTVLIACAGLAAVAFLPWDRMPAQPSIKLAEREQEVPKADPPEPLATLAPNSPEAPKKQVAPPVEIAAAPTVLDLDALPVGVAHPLLSQAPVAAQWNPDDNATYLYDPERRRLNLSMTHDVALFHLGKVTVPDFTFKISIKQSLWTSGPGIYWGYRTETSHPKFTSRTNLQTLRVVRRSSPERLVLVRGRISYDFDRSGKKSTTYSDRYESPIASPSGELVLFCRFARRSLAQVTVDGRELREVCPTLPFRPDESSDGYLGTFTQLATCSYRDAYFQLEPKAP